MYTEALGLPSTTARVDELAHWVQWAYTADTPEKTRYNLSRWWEEKARFYNYVTPDERVMLDKLDMYANAKLAEIEHKAANEGFSLFGKSSKTTEKEAAAVNAWKAANAAAARVGLDARAAAEARGVAPREQDLRFSESLLRFTGTAGEKTRQQIEQGAASATIAGQTESFLGRPLLGVPTWAWLALGGGAVLMLVISSVGGRR